MSTPSPWRDPRYRFDLWLLVGAGAVTLIFCSQVALGLRLGLSEWSWPYGPQPGAAFWLPLFPLIALLAIAWSRPNLGSRMHRTAWLIGLVLASFAMQLATFGMQPRNRASLGATWMAGAVVLSPVATSYFGEAIKADDLTELMEQFPQRLASMPYHARTHPPGPIAFFWLVNQAVQDVPGIEPAGRWLVESISGLSLSDFANRYQRMFGRHYGGVVTATDTLSAILAAFLMSFLGSLSIIPVFYLTRDLLGGRAAMWCCILWATIPSFALFAPEMDQLVLLWAMLSLWLLRDAWRSGRAWLALIGGVTYGLGLFTSLGLLCLIPMLLIWAWLETRAVGARHTMPPLKPLFWGAIGAIGLFVVLYLTLRFNMIATIAQGLFAHRAEITERFPRPYWRWVGFNLVDFAIFLGLPLAIWTVRCAIGLRRSRDSAAAKLRPLLLSWLVTVLLLDMSGVVRAETGRIWLFLMPPLVLLCATRLASWDERAGRWGMALLLSAQVLQIIAFQVVLRLFVLF